MAGDSCGDVVNRKPGENFGCNVSNEHFALANGTWREMVAEMLQTKYSMRDLVVISVRGFCVGQYEMLGDGCVDVVNKKTP